MERINMDTRNLELISDELADLFKRKTPGEKLSMAFSMWDTARDLIHAHITSLHPEWHEEMKAREVARRLSHGSF
jgi:hypothetical protein